MTVPSERTCSVCRRKAPKAELLRFGVEGDRVVFDPRRNQRGRGSYCCKTRTCLLKLNEERRLKWMFRSSSCLQPVDIENLLAEVEKKELGLV